MSITPAERPPAPQSTHGDPRADRDRASAGPQRSLRVAIVDEELPYPPDSGKRIRTCNLLLPLARRHRLTYISHPSADPAETAAAVDFLRTHGIEPLLVGRRLPSKAGPAFYARLLGNLLSPLPYSVQVHNSAALRHALRQYAASHAVDLWHCEWTPYAESLRRAVAGPWVVMAHNVESLIWQRYYQHEPHPAKRWYIKRQWRKFQRFERQIFAAATRTVAVSDNDAALARGEFGATGVEVVENGVDAASFAPDGSARDSRRILFLGSLDWRPNLDAVQLLLDQIFPQVLKHEPAAQLVLVGRKPSAWLVDRVIGYPNVELHADVADVRPFLRQCGMLTVPLRIGGGSRLKILEALATECPVVSTRVGAEGLELIAGQHFAQADAAEGMAAALVEGIRHPQRLLEMARLGGQLVRQRYDWSILAAKLEAVWLGAC
jgi:glycosyltransferase involved in cell wall biosynthesis